LRDKLNVEKKLKEAQVRSVQAEKMASLGQLAAGVAHEINNPLTGIILYGNMTLERLDETNPLREYMEFVLEDASRCKDIVKHLLEYSRQTSPSKEIFHINTLVEQSLHLIRDQKRFQNVEIIKNLTDEMMMVHGDKNQLNQVIINLVMNAVDAMDMHGSLTIRTYRNKEYKKVFLEISDTGGGIEKENISKIFDPFFTTKGVDKGTGLGLSTSYGIVKENGGLISIKDTGPKGTTFLVELPLYEPVG
jgi:signal transduction histidine kinase